MHRGAFVPQDKILKSPDHQLFMCPACQMIDRYFLRESRRASIKQFLPRSTCLGKYMGYDSAGKPF
jgi:hypothetical protein